MKTKYLSIIILYFISQNIFSQENDQILFQAPDYSFPYDLNEPISRIKLPKTLEEISGLSYLDEHNLASIQDERGNIYIINITTGKITKKVPFNGDGDYEGIELVNEDAWVLKSNGTLIQVKNFLNKKERISIKHKTLLTSRNNCEGLAYDSINNRLLIACKGYPFIGDKKGGKNKKAVYEYDLFTDSLSSNPEIIIHLDSIKSFYNHNNIAKMGIKLLSFFDSSEGDLTFQPSGIAIHPISNNLYLLGSVGKLIIILDDKYEFKAIIQMNKKLFPQAEGICFDPKGNLFISNEGKDRNARLLKFEMLNID
jgi:uncharacterized protein YjiK